MRKNRKSQTCRDFLTSEKNSVITERGLDVMLIWTVDPRCLYSGFHRAPHQSCKITGAFIFCTVVRPGCCPPFHGATVC